MPYKVARKNNCGIPNFKLKTEFGHQGKDNSDSSLLRYDAFSRSVSCHRELSELPN